MRHQLSGRGSDATASFAGSALTLSVAGVERKATLGTIGAGASLDVLPRGSVFVGYRGDIGRNGTGHSVNSGFRVIF